MRYTFLGFIVGLSEAVPRIWALCLEPLIFGPSRSQPTWATPSRAVVALFPKDAVGCEGEGSAPLLFKNHDFMRLTLAESAPEVQQSRSLGVAETWWKSAAARKRFGLGMLRRERKNCYGRKVIEQFALPQRPH
jgi:hypothetical protein